VIIAMRRLVAGSPISPGVTAGFGWVTGIAPTLIAAPLYFSGKTSFGGMMMAAPRSARHKDRCAGSSTTSVRSRIGEPCCCAWRISAPR